MQIRAPSIPITLIPSGLVLAALLLSATPAAARVDGDEVNCPGGTGTCPRAAIT